MKKKKKMLGARKRLELVSGSIVSEWKSLYGAKKVEKEEGRVWTTNFILLVVCFVSIGWGGSHAWGCGLFCL